MGVIDYFKPVSSLPRDDARKWLRQRHPDDFLLLDVRQPEEFASSHLPGAMSVPIGELPDRIEELSRHLPVLVYCRFGLRSRAAAGMLQGAGFGDVYTLEGGFEGWEGETASDLPDQARAALSLDSPEELIASVWMMEDGTEKFYRKIADECSDSRIAELFQQLSMAEKSHKKTLAALYEAFSGKTSDLDFARCQPSKKGNEEQQVEGGMLFQDVCAWAQGRGPVELVDLAVAIETNAYDRCLAIRRCLEDQNLQRILEIVASDERRHLDRLLEVYAEIAGSHC